MRDLNFFERRVLKQVRDPNFHLQERMLLLLAVSSLVAAVFSFLMTMLSIHSLSLGQSQIMFGGLALGAGGLMYFHRAALSLARKLDSRDDNVETPHHTAWWVPYLSLLSIGSGVLLILLTYIFWDGSSLTLFTGIGFLGLGCAIPMLWY